MLDKPTGLFNLVVELLSDLLSSVSSVELLSNSAVHPGLTQLLRCVCRQLKGTFSEAEEGPSIGMLEVLQLVNAIAKRTADQPFLIKMLISKQADSSDTSEVVCLPFEILVAYYKQQGGGSPGERMTLRSVILKSLQA